jgi:phosphoribosyl-AMP cyclohydrolase
MAYNVQLLPGPASGDNVSEQAIEFQSRLSVKQVEEGTDLAPRFDDHGLIAAVTTDAHSGELLMQGYMNADALRLTITTGEAHYFSRSRRAIWHKGATSGLLQMVKEILIDDDQDCIWLKVEVIGGASCHVGYRSCFYRRIPLSAVAGKPLGLEFTDTQKVFDPDEVYGDAPSPTLL